MNQKEKMVMAYGMVEAICMMLPDRFTSDDIEQPAKEIIRAVQIKLMITDSDMTKIINDLNKEGSEVYRMVVDTYKEKTNEIQNSTEVS